jgi:preprotein translocase subunit YajC
VDLNVLMAMAPPPSNGGQSPGTMYYVVMMALMMGVFYMILIRPQRRRDQERKAMLANIKTGDRVLFSGGIIGTVANVKEKAFIIRIAEKVKVEVSRGAVTHILPKGEDPPDPNET